MKDVKTYLKLTRAAKNCEARKTLTGEAMGAYDSNLFISQQVGRESQRIWYQGVTDDANEEVAKNRIDVELDKRLCAVIQSIETGGFYKTDSRSGKKESEHQFRTRLHDSMNANMDIIDEEQGQIQRNDDIRRKEVLVVDHSRLDRSSKIGGRKIKGAGNSLNKDGPPKPSHTPKIYKGSSWKGKDCVKRQLPTSCGSSGSTAAGAQALLSLYPEKRPI